MEGRNNHIFSGVYVLVMELKTLYLISLFEWSSTLGTNDMHFLVDFIGSLLECNSLGELCSQLVCIRSFLHVKKNLSSIKNKNKSTKFKIVTYRLQKN